MAAHGVRWMREYWDRYIRDEKHFASTVAYIHNNPVKAALVAHAVDWPWSSARNTGPGNAEPWSAFPGSASPGSAEPQLGIFWKEAELGLGAPDGTPDQGTGE